MDFGGLCGRRRLLHFYPVYQCPSAKDRGSIDVPEPKGRIFGDVDVRSDLRVTVNVKVNNADAGMEVQRRDKGEVEPG